MIGKKRSRIKLPRKEYEALLAEVFHRDKWKCRNCKSRNNLTAHHLIYRSHGGDDANWNLITLCGTCHDGIHKPNPTTGAMLIILPQVEGQPIDANKPVKFLPVNGFNPRRAA